MSDSRNWTSNIGDIIKNSIIESEVCKKGAQYAQDKS